MKWMQQWSPENQALSSPKELSTIRYNDVVQCHDYNCKIRKKKYNLLSLPSLEAGCQETTQQLIVSTEIEFIIAKLFQQQRRKTHISSIHSATRGRLLEKGSSYLKGNIDVLHSLNCIHINDKHQKKKQWEKGEKRL